MKKILGIDLGTNSIGWALVEQHFAAALDESGQRKLSQFELKDKGVRLFQEGVKIEKGVESSKAAERTGYRSARKLKFRRKLRKYETLKVLIAADMCPLDREDLEKWRQHVNPETGKTETFHHYPKSQAFIDWLQCDRSRGISPYYIRDKASREKMSDSFLLGRAFYHLAQRRGFLSNRLDVAEESPVERHADELLGLLQDAPNAASLSESLEEYFAQIALDDEPELKRLYRAIQKILASEKDYDLVKRQITGRLESKENLGPVKKEIAALSEAIKAAGCETAGQYYYQIEQRDFSQVPLDELSGKLRRVRNQHMHREEHYLHEFQVICKKQNVPLQLQNKLERAIFFQRPLRSQKGAVARCTLEPGKPRCPSSHPSFELYRMLAFINNIRIIKGEEKARPLDEDQKKAIYPKFFRISKKSFPFEDLKKVLGKHLQFNYRDHHTVSGCPTTAALMNWFGQEWKTDDWQDRSWEAICKQPHWQQTLQQALVQNHPDADDNKPVVAAVNDVWHVLQTFDSLQKLEDYGRDKLGFPEKEAQRFAKTRLLAGYSQLSIKAIHKILPYLIDGDVSSAAITKAKLEDIVKPELWRVVSHRREISQAIQDIESGFGREQHAARLANNLINLHKKSSNVPMNRPEVISELSENYQVELNEVFDEESERQKKRVEFEKCLKANAFMKVDSKHERIKRFLLDNDLATEEKALDKLYDPRSMGQFLPPVKDSKTGTVLLNSPAISSVKNPMAMRALYQLKKLLNELILEGKIDEHTTIHLEMARQLNDANKRKAVERYQRDREQKREAARTEIKKLYKDACGKAIEPNDTEVLIYELWLEQNKVCLYSGQSLGICDILGESAQCDIEHTVPRSQSFDNSRENNTVATRKANRAKGNHLPSQLEENEVLLSHAEILAGINHWKERYEQLGKEISRLKRQSFTTKEQKDENIQKRHLKQLELDYWKNKYRKFTLKEVPSGFKNSQLVDTGIITRFARNYLKTYFNLVKCIKGSVTSQFRKAWFEGEKNRNNHIHHLEDAIILACITSDRHDAFVQYYKALEEEDKKRAKGILAHSVPWSSFRTDMKTLGTDVKVAHHTPHNMESPTRKRMRIRGKVKRDKNGKIIWQQGDSARGSLHKETFYGAVYPPGLPKDDKHLKFVVRKHLRDLSAADVKNIVDPVARQKIEEAVERGDLVIRAGNLQNKLEKPVWMNEAKRIPIHKVRCYTRLSNPLKVKEHRDHKTGSTHMHKHYLLAENDENYLMALYQEVDSKGKVKREFELVNNLEAADFFKTSNPDRKTTTLYPENKLKAKVLLPFYAALKKGTMLLLKKEEQEDIFALSSEEQARRLYKVTGLESDGRINMRFHQQGGMDKDLPKASKPVFDDIPAPKLRLGYAALRAAVEGKDFVLTATGQIKRPNQ